MLTKKLVQTLKKKKNTKNVRLSRSLYRKGKNLMTGKVEEDPLKYQC
jgi:hypothetical protein